MAIDTIDDLIVKAGDNHNHRQRETFNLIPSENTPSNLVLELSRLDSVGRYGEHRRNKAFGKSSKDVFFYQGTDFIAKVEEAVQDFFRKYLGCSEADVRPISGQQSNEIVFRAVMNYFNRFRKGEPQRIQSVMNHDLNYGGHLSAQQGMGSLGPFVRVDPLTGMAAAIPFPLDKNNPYQIDVSRTQELMQQYGPRLMIFGKSMVLEEEPVSELSELAKELGTIIMGDRSHVMGLSKKPADIYTCSTHKTFFGTQRGIIASNMSEGTEYSALWEKIVNATFPGSMSNHHLGTLVGLLGACFEWQEFGLDYRAQVTANAKAFAKALKEKGLKVEGDPSKGYTETHQVILNVGYAADGRLRGPEIAHILEKNNIITNAQVLPYDAATSGSRGIRMGVQEMTRFGMKEGDFGQLAEFMADIIVRGLDRSKEISEYRKQFLEMQYCFPKQKETALKERILQAA